MIVYKVLNTMTGMAYVGITVRPLYVRWKAHLATARGKKPSELHRAISQYGADAFIVTELAVAETFDELKRLEIQYIKELQTRYPLGYNKTLGGQGVLGMVMPESARRQISRLARERGALSEGTKAKISAALMGRKMDVSAVEKSSAARRGVKRTPEQVERITHGNLGKNVGNGYARRYPPHVIEQALALLHSGASGKDVVIETGLTQSYVSRLKAGSRGVSITQRN